MSFTRTIENFICEQCGASVTGTGYTNHCPKCLWSKHVDIHPGDRSSPCGGSMQPMSVGVFSGIEKITHKCVVCDFVRFQRVSEDDSRDVVIQLSAQPFTS